MEGERRHVKGEKVKGEGVKGKGGKVEKRKDGKIEGGRCKVERGVWKCGSCKVNGGRQTVKREG